jgi:hypothetical protein
VEKAFDLMPIDLKSVSNPLEQKDHYVILIRISGQWIPFDDTCVDAVKRSEAIPENFPEPDGSNQTGMILLYVSGN